MAGEPRLLILACGALAREIVALQTANGWTGVDVQCLPPELHNRPERIPGAVRNAVAAARPRYAGIFVAYADCGTGGLLDAVLRDAGVERLPGAHCYEAFATGSRFAALAEEVPGTYFLTDFLVRHFERLFVVGLGLDRHPELAAEYLRNYQRVLYLVQRPDDALRRQARAIAARFGLAYEERRTGYGDVGTTLRRWVDGDHGSESRAVGGVLEPVRWHR